MPDVYATITQADRAVQECLADVIEQRAADPRHQAMFIERARALARDLASVSRVRRRPRAAAGGGVVRRCRHQHHAQPCAAARAWFGHIAFTSLIAGKPHASG